MRRGPSAALAAVAAVVAVLAVGLGLAHGDQPLEGRLVTPLMGWTSSGAYFASDQAAEALQLKTTSDLAATLADLLGGIVQPGTGSKGAAAPLLNAAALADGAPEVVMVLLGSQLRTTDLRRKRAAPLQALVEGAASSVALPYVVHAPAAEGGPRRAIEARLAGTGAELLTAGCGEGLSLDALPQLLADAAAGPPAPLVVLGCIAVAPADSGTEAGLEGELRQVAAAHAALSAHGRRAVTLLAIDPHAAAGDGGAAAAGGATAEQRRRLLAAGAAVGYTECDARCKAQVKWLQGMLALLLIIVATLSGLCCLSVLDTPTRFETPKDASRTD